ncbi:hypothetical protein [Neobacillus drentensis]|uniref:hypothetical protein n=1 Tax=Neobacillus drentensis TaxID=220684 RepID=UPI00285B0A8D|nr:hypothetical protein [Neobacillus drentensis]MDR7237413.1 Tfp pilus assembly protein PilV [Neobacillus drentensis]
MVKLRDERGMTLVIVLLVLLVFSVIGLAIVGASVNNIKQVKTTEENVQTVDIAEMGVQHYQNILESFFHDQITIKKDIYKKLLEKEFELHGDVSNTFIEDKEDQLANELMNLYTTSSISPVKQAVNETVDNQTNSKYEINNSNLKITSSDVSFDPPCLTCNSSNTKKKIELTYQSFGYKDQDLEKKLTATFSFTFYINKAGIQYNPSTDFATIINKPDDVNPCVASDVNGKASIEEYCEYNSLVTLDTPSEIKNSHLVFNKGLTVNQVMSGSGKTDGEKGAILNSTLYINGALTLNKQINGINGSKIYINGTTTVPTSTTQFEKINPGGIQFSTIVILGKVNFTGQVKGIHHSNIYIVGTADFAGATFKKIDNEDSAICVNGTITNLADQSKTGKFIYDDKDPEFSTKCSVTRLNLTNEFMKWDEDTTPLVDYSN